MAFSFGFQSDDIDDDENEDVDMAEEQIPAKYNHHLEPVRWHTLDDMLATLPSQISYTLHTISENPLIRLPRRDLFDIRAQLLAETDISTTKITTLADVLVSDDIKPGLYEGGFKTWECSLDLAKLVLSGEARSLKDGHLIELGSGTALPSCAILHQFLQESASETPDAAASISERTLILADYNEHVLTHASVANLLLTFITSNASSNLEIAESERGSIELDAAVLDSFRSWLIHNKIRIFGVSGAWGPSFGDIVREHVQGPGLVLASETIYSPDSIKSFTEVLLSLMRGSLSTNQHNQALIAAKKVYFGVGGGIDEFVAHLAHAGGMAEKVWESGEEGVGRAILSVRLL